MEKHLSEKLDKLKQYLEKLGSAAIAFSGGVDSTFLLQTAHEVLGEMHWLLPSVRKLFPEGRQKSPRSFVRPKVYLRLYWILSPWNWRSL